MESDCELNLYAMIETLQPWIMISQTSLQASYSIVRKTVLQLPTQGLSRPMPAQLPSQEAPTPETLLAIVGPMFAGKTMRLMQYAE